MSTESGNYSVLAGGGEMGALARTVDWSQTAVGPVNAWPQSLRTAVSILLESKFPMLLCWSGDFVQFYNDPFRPILGASKHPAFGKSARETFPEAWHIIGPLFEQVMRGTAVGFDDMLVPLDRYGFLEECYFTYSYSPIRDESGGIGGVLVTCTETTARLVAERRLRTLRELASQGAQVQQERAAWRGALQVLAANASDVPFCLLYELDRDGATATLVEAATPIGAAALVQATDRDPAWPLFEAVAAGGPVVVKGLRGRFGDHAGPVWAEPVDAAVVLPITRPGLPQPYGVLVAGVSPRLPLDDRYRDFLSLVSDQIATAVGNARAYEEEKRRTEALVEIDRQKTAFFSSVSHEFRTPLTLMLGPVESALARTPPVLAGGDLDLVYRNATRLLRLVNTLLDFSRIEAGRFTVNPQPTDLAALTRDIASSFESLMSRAGLRFELECPPLSGPATVDRDMWEKIVLNLLSNAYKFTLAGAVRVRLHESAEAVQLVVEDTGSGIPAEDLPRIFDRFHRAAATPARTFEGSGIGLSLVRELARMHGGDVAVDSTPGRGSTFTVTLPFRRDAAATAASASGSASAAIAYLEEARRWEGDAAPAAAEPATAPLHASRVLVVDDNADMREYLGRVLGQFWHVDLAANGRQALELIAQRRPDAMVTDVMMPEVDGIDLLRRIRADAATRLIPVLVLSARSGEESRIEGLAAGADDYVVKPFSSNELVARVRTHLELSQLRQEALAQHQRLLSMIDLAPAAIAVLHGPDHVFELANARYLKLVGRAGIIGKPGRVALPELVAQGVWDLCDSVYHSGTPYFGNEFRVRLDRGAADLDDGYFNFVLQPLEDSRGVVEGILVHAVEITEQVVARQEVERAKRSAEEANRAKDDFLAMLGHELRNPLAPILTALQLMSLRGDRGAEKERAIIDRQVRHVVRLVDDLLDVSRIARGKIELALETVELTAVVAKAVETVSPVIEQKRHQLTIDVPAGLAVDADAARMHQVVFNLLHNAAKYTEAEGRIDITARRREDGVELSVRDTGVGIEPEMLPHVFDLFFQERQALDRAQGGLGLGLAIVRNLVSLHGGTVRVTSKGRGRGSEFAVTLPLSRRQEAPAAADTAPSKAPAETTSPMRVLVVDDNEDAVMLLAEALRFAGFDTRTALNGPDALDTAAAYLPDVVILDLGLPMMDGYEVAARLRERGNVPTLIAVTGYGASGDQARTRESGFDLHLVKPIDIDRLLLYLRGVDETSSSSGTGIRGISTSPPR